VEPSRWLDLVHTPELEDRAHLLWKQPNYAKPLPTEGT
jgi:4-oxalocrotonate tautomerase